jgi:hypothetical protein
MLLFDSTMYRFIRRLPLSKQAIRYKSATVASYFSVYPMICNEWV